MKFFFIYIPQYLTGNILPMSSFLNKIIHNFHLYDRPVIYAHKYCIDYFASICKLHLLCPISYVSLSYSDFYSSIHNNHMEIFIHLFILSNLKANLSYICFLPLFLDFILTCFHIIILHCNGYSTFVNINCSNIILICMIIF